MVKGMTVGDLVKTVRIDCKSKRTKKKIKFGFYRTGMIIEVNDVTERVRVAWHKKVYKPSGFCVILKNKTWCYTDSLLRIKEQD